MAMGEAKRRKSILGDRYGKTERLESQPSDLQLQAWLTSGEVLGWVEQAISFETSEWKAMMTQLLQEVLKDKNHDHIICNPAYSVAIGVNTGSWGLWAGVCGRNRNPDAFLDCPHLLKPVEEVVNQ
jgi:hypothetical protein